jgi:hypothetical protein
MFSTVTEHSGKMPRIAAPARQILKSGHLVVVIGGDQNRPA